MYKPTSMGITSMHILIFISFQSVNYILRKHLYMMMRVFNDLNWLNYPRTFKYELPVRPNTEKYLN